MSRVPTPSPAPLETSGESVLPSWVGGGPHHQGRGLDVDGWRRVLREPVPSKAKRGDLRNSNS